MRGTEEEELTNRGHFIEQYERLSLNGCTAAMVSEDVRGEIETHGLSSLSIHTYLQTYMEGRTYLLISISLHVGCHVKEVRGRCGADVKAVDSKNHCLPPAVESSCREKLTERHRRGPASAVCSSLTKRTRRWSTREIHLSLNLLFLARRETHCVC